jgi:hypothetical protein
MSVAFSPDGHTLLTATQWWLHVWRKSGEEWQPFAHRLLPGPMKWDAKFFFPDPAATQIKAALGVTGDALQIVTLRLDGYDTEPIQGDPKVLLEEWQKRLGLRINEAGEIVPAHQ